MSVSPENCPDPSYHEMFYYCPNCSWTSDKNCEETAVVNFGLASGTVLIRCTKMGEHETHACEVRWNR